MASEKSLTRLALLLAVLSVQGCMFVDVATQREIIESYCVIEGDVSAERSDPVPLIVALMQQTGNDPALRESWQLADHFVTEGVGHWRFRVSAGSYGLVAFQDLNSDLRHDPDEPFLRLESERIFACRTGEAHANFALSIPADGRPRVIESLDLSNLTARSLDEQLQVTLGSMVVRGEIVQLSDPRFADAVARDGLWRPFDFLFNGKPGIYFLEPYDPDKMPVLFVHGIQGSPANFRTLVERLDRRHFQPWLVYYPSGVSLDAIADYLTQSFRMLQVQYRFDRFAVVAHSMGGLVSRGFILRYTDSGGRADTPLFVTISTPWGGHKSAELGVKTAPAVVKVWIDMAPDSPYQRALFYKDPETKNSPRALPQGVAHHLVFTFRQDSMTMGEANDGSVTVASQLLPAAQHDATRPYGFDETHTSVLESADASALVNRLLQQALGGYDCLDAPSATDGGVTALSRCPSTP
jgi:pimeloyl-ACP methyl ester carboxylesterase